MSGEDAAGDDLGGAQFLALFSATFLASAPLSLIGGIATDGVDRKRLYVGNFAVEALTLVAFGLVALPVAGPAAGLPLFLVGTALYVCQTAFEPAVAVFFFDAFDDDEAGRAWGIDGMASKGAGIVAPTAGSLLYARVPAAPFVAGAVLLVAATAVAAWTSSLADTS